MKNKQSSIKLFVKPDDKKPFGEWPFVWLMDKEIPEYTKKGYIRVKKLAKKGY